MRYYFYFNNLSITMLCYVRFWKRIIISRLFPLHGVIKGLKWIGPCSSAQLCLKLIIINTNRPLFDMSTINTDPDLSLPKSRIFSSRACTTCRHTIEGLWESRKRNFYTRNFWRIETETQEKNTPKSAFNRHPTSYKSH